MEAGSSIWFNAVLRGDHEKIHIGRGSNVQDGCAVHTDPGFAVTVGEDVTIGHNATVHGCTIKDRSLIGMGCTILNGAVVGPESLVAAGSVVREGQVVEPGTLVAGIPAKVIRKLTDEERKKLLDGAKHYVLNAKVYLETFDPMD
ncbi:gamma carbonic anhydrase family protein [Planococcus lenghuensis]|nr:gamma carbonic anhydrase family protein [Planococcus lenghuensis]